MKPPHSLKSFVTTNQFSKVKKHIQAKNTEYQKHGGLIKRYGVTTSIPKEGY